MKLLKTKLQLNISVPVGISTGPRGGIVKERSKPGEYPRTDSGELLRSIHYMVRRTVRGPEGAVWSTAGHANPLEFGLQRKLFRATYLECLPLIRLILTRPGLNPNLSAISWNETE